MAACLAAAWAEWTCNEDCSSVVKLTPVGAVTSAGRLVSTSLNQRFAVRGARVVSPMTRTLKAADRDPLMNPRILEPRFGGAFF
jgi:hypothetical protein